MMIRQSSPIVDSYNTEEEYLYEKSYNFIKGYALALKLTNTLRALPLVRIAHNGQYRQGMTLVNGQEVRLPYVLHVLKVCSTLISLDLELPKDTYDIMLASSLCHDLLEDCGDRFKEDGENLVTEYGFPQEVLDRVRLLSKRSGLDEHDLNDYFNRIKKDPSTLLIKLADRSHNVEDLYNMRIERLHKYVDETRRWIYPLCSYGKAHYPSLSNGFNILKAKIVSLTEATEAIVDMYEKKIEEKDKEIIMLREQLATFQLDTIEDVADSEEALLGSA